jgi:hypothetical protein
MSDVRNTCLRLQVDTLFQLENLKGRPHSGDPDTDARTITITLKDKTCIRI